MLFVASEGFTSAKLRGQDVAKEMQCPFAVRMDDTENDIVVFVKWASNGDFKKAKDQGNLVVYDVIDFFCYPGRRLGWEPDVLIVPNTACMPYYAKMFPKARQVVIPHHWDPMIPGTASNDMPRLGYIGSAFNMPVTKRHLQAVVYESHMVPSASKFNLHLCVSRRDGDSALLKPATKLAFASAVGACAIVYPDPSATELLGVEYPFYVQWDLDKAIDDAIEAFGTDRWEKARATMAKVKEKTSIQAVAKLYKEIADVRIPAL